MKNLLIPTLIGAFSIVSADAVPLDLLEQLDADQFEMRSKAQEDLMKWAKGAKKDEIKELRKAYEGAESPEVKMRLFDILDNTTFMAQPNTRGFVGITMDPKLGGVGIQRVEPNAPANQVDLRVGDIIIEVDKKNLLEKKGDIEEATDFFSAYVKSKNAGEKLELKIDRKGKILEKTLKLGDYDKFTQQFLQQPPEQFLLQNGRRLQMAPNAQLRMQVRPQGAKPNAQVPDIDIAELQKAVELQLRRAEEQRKTLEEKKKELKQLRLKLEQKLEK